MRVGGEAGRADFGEGGRGSCETEGEQLLSKLTAACAGGADLETVLVVVSAVVVFMVVVVVVVVPVSAVVSMVPVLVLVLISVVTLVLVMILVSLVAVLVGISEVDAVDITAACLATVETALGTTADLLLALLLP